MDVFFFNNTATTEIYTLSLHDALPIWGHAAQRLGDGAHGPARRLLGDRGLVRQPLDQPPLRHRNRHAGRTRSEEHTSELQSRQYLVCRLLLEKKTHRMNLHSNAF